MIKVRKTYLSCYDLPLHNFIKIVCKDDYSLLYAEPSSFIHKQADLNSIWADIFEEYQELTGNEESKYIFDLHKRISLINNDLAIIQQIVTLLANRNSAEGMEELTDILRKKLGVRFAFKENLQEELAKCVSVAKRKVSDLNQSRHDYNEMNKDEGKKATEQDYNNLIASLSKYMGFEINKFTTTVAQYISYINQFKNAKPTID